MPGVVTQLDHAAIGLTPWGAGEFSVAEAKAIGQHFGEVSTSCNIDNFLGGFTTDGVVSFNEPANLSRSRLGRSSRQPQVCTC